ncbi:MAG TPA: acetylornithine deacetylase [Thiolinea sp.]|nr:acetylornithine deacetylase [Thiolinea sp.]
MNSRELLARLISFDTTSAVSNLALIHFVQEYLANYGVESSLVRDESGQKANLYATIGPADKAGVMLSGHTDVVPVKGQAWSSDPFVLTERDGLLYGRGSCDMKGFIASCLAAVPALTQAKLHTPVHLALSYDEEVGCLGVRRLIEMMQGLSVRPAMAIIGEPTSMRLMIAHKGKRAIRVKITGQSAHSAYPTEGVNAVEYAAELVCEIRRIHAQFQQHGPFDNDYRVPHTTLHVGVFNGGTVLNIVPNACQFDFEIRHLPEDNPDQIIQRIQNYAEQVLLPPMRKVTEQAKIEFEVLSAYPGLYTAPDAQVVQFVRGLLAPNVEVSKISFGTEGGLFNEQLGIPAVVCGPGSILQAHKADEYVSVEQLAACDAMLELLQRVLSD